MQGGGTSGMLFREKQERNNKPVLKMIRFESYGPEQCRKSHYANFRGHVPVPGGSVGNRCS